MRSEIEFITYCLSEYRIHSTLKHKVPGAHVHSHYNTPKTSVGLNGVVLRHRETSYFFFMMFIVTSTKLGFLFLYLKDNELVYLVVHHHVADVLYRHSTVF
jgi:hypothetical protein